MGVDIMSIVLIGGESTKDSFIHSTIVSLTNLQQPNFLFIGLASQYSDSKYDFMKKLYSSLNCNCMYLKRKNLIHNPDIASNKINCADIIYFCGGDTIKLLEDIHSFHLESLLKDAFNRGVILAGSSAGAILLSKKGFSDSYILRGESDSYSFIDGLGFCDLMICPHYHDNPNKMKQLQDSLSFNDTVYGLEDDTAIIVDQDKISYIQSPNHHVYKITYDKELIEEKCI